MQCGPVFRDQAIFLVGCRVARPLQPRLNEGLCLEWFSGCGDIPTSPRDARTPASAYTVRKPMGCHHVLRAEDLYFCPRALLEKQAWNIVEFRKRLLPSPRPYPLRMTNRQLSACCKSTNTKDISAHLPRSSLCLLWTDLRIPAIELLLLQRNSEPLELE